MNKRHEDSKTGVKKLKRRSLKEGYDPDYESKAYDKDYYDNHEKYYEKAIPYFEQYLEDNFDFESIADIGCGNGAFLENLQMVKKVIGVDFSIGSQESLKLYPENFYIRDISTPNALRDLPNVDIVMSLEVAEHIFPEYEENYVNNLFSLNPKYVIISWAVPGQIGRRHVNLKTKEEAIEAIRSRFPNYTVDDERTEAFKKIKYLASFYRNNTVVYRRNDVE